MKTVLKFLHYFIKMNTYIFFITLIYFIQKFITKLIFGFENICVDLEPFQFIQFGLRPVEHLVCHILSGFDHPQACSRRRYLQTHRTPRNRQSALHLRTHRNEIHPVLQRLNDLHIHLRGPVVTVLQSDQARADCNSDFFHSGFPVLFTDG